MTSKINIIKMLRKLTSAKIYECATALRKNSYNIEKAVRYLKKCKASIKLNKDSLLQGTIHVTQNQNQNFLIIAKCSCESSFASQSYKFAFLIKKLIDIKQMFLREILRNNSYKYYIYYNNKLVLQNISTFGEKILQKKISVLLVNYCKTLIYIHNKINNNAGRIIVLTTVTKNSHTKSTLLKSVLLHIASTCFIVKKLDNIKYNLLLHKVSSYVCYSEKYSKIFIVKNSFKDLVYKHIERIVLQEQDLVIYNKIKLKHLLSSMENINNIVIRKYRKFSL